MRNPTEVRLNTQMTLGDIYQQLTTLGNITSAPHTKTEFDQQGTEILYVRKPLAADKLKRMVATAEMREVNRERLMCLIDEVVRRVDIKDADSMLESLRKSLRKEDGSFLDQLGKLVTHMNLSNYTKGSNSLF